MLRSQVIDEFPSSPYSDTRSSNTLTLCIVLLANFPGAWLLPAYVSLPIALVLSLPYSTSLPYLWTALSHRVAKAYTWKLPLPEQCGVTNGAGGADQEEW